MTQRHPIDEIKIKQVEDRQILTPLEWIILFANVRISDTAEQAAEELQEYRNTLRRTFVWIAEKVEDREIATTEDKELLETIERLTGDKKA